MNDYEWGFSAGLLNDGENVEEAVARELLEETGYKVKKIFMKSPFLVNSAGMSDEMTSIVFVEVYPTPEDQQLEASEDIKIYIKDYKEVAELLTQNNIFSSKAWIILKYFSKTNSLFF